MDKKVTVSWNAQLATLFDENRKVHARLDQVCERQTDELSERREIATKLQSNLDKTEKQDQLLQQMSQSIENLCAGMRSLTSASATAAPRVHASTPWDNTPGLSYIEPGQRVPDETFVAGQFTQYTAPMVFTNVPENISTPRLKLSDSDGMATPTPPTYKQVSEGRQRTESARGETDSARLRTDASATPHPQRGISAEGAIGYQPYQHRNHPNWRGTFTGDQGEDLQAYIAQLEYYATSYGLTERSVASILLSSLRGKAAMLCCQVKRDATYDDIVELLKQRFAPLATPMHLACEFKNAKRQKDEDVRDFLDRLKTLATKAFPGHPKRVVDERLLEQFIDGQDPRIKWMTAGYDLPNIDVALKKIVQVEESFKSTGISDPASFSPYGYNKRSRMVDVTPPIQKGEDTSDDNLLETDNVRWLMDALNDISCDEIGHFEETEVFTILQSSTDRPNTARGKGNNGPCYFCKREGHGWRRCYRLRNLLRKNGMKDDGDFPKDTKQFTAKQKTPLN